MADDSVRTRHFVAGDPLRAIAALGVMVVHTVQILEAHSREPLRDHFGHYPSLLLLDTALGLFIFFVLSGYLIAGPFVRAFIDERPAPRFWAYAERRLLRIVPAFWVALTVSLIVLGTGGASTARVLAVYGFLQQAWVSVFGLRFQQAWTLQVELGFYALVPVGFWFASRVWRGHDRAGRIKFAVFAILLVAALSLSLQGLFAVGHDSTGAPCMCGTALRSIPATLFTFMPGVLLVVAEVALARRAAASQRYRNIGIPLVLAGLVSWVLFTAVPGDQLLLRGFFEALGAGLLVAGVMWRQWAAGGSWRVLDNRVMHWLGERSYSIYVVHFVIVYEVVDNVSFDSSVPTYILRTLLAWAAVIATSALSYALVERPALNFKARRLGTTQATT